jgi:hypothetical protein
VCVTISIIIKTFKSENEESVESQEQIRRWKAEVVNEKEEEEVGFEEEEEENNNIERTLHCRDCSC